MPMRPMSKCEEAVDIALPLIARPHSSSRRLLSLLLVGLFLLSRHGNLCGVHSATIDNATTDSVRSCQQLITDMSASRSNAPAIQSPNYPEKYSKNEHCIYVMRAPKNHVVVLKQAENFDVEPSEECSYDYLEIRDGQYGYSPLIGRFCDTNAIALPIESSGRELWLKFNSDESIQSHGFRILYEFRKLLRPKAEKLARLVPSLPKCEMFITSADFRHVNASRRVTNADIEAFFEARVDELARTSTNYTHAVVSELKRNVDCTVHVEVEKYEKIFVGIEDINIFLTPFNQSQLAKQGSSSSTFSSSSSTFSSLSSSTRRSNCTENLIQVFDGSTSAHNRKAHICLSDSNKYWKSQTNQVFIHYVFRKHSERDSVSFKAILNIFTPGPCSNDSFRCNDNACIARQLVCDQQSNCLDKNDESDCVQHKNVNKIRQQKWTVEQKMTYLHRTIIITIGFILTVIIVASVIISCKRSIKSNRKKRKEFQMMHQMMRLVAQNDDTFVEVHSLPPSNESECVWITERAM